MRLLLAASLILAAGACNAKPAPSNEAAAALPGSEAVTRKAADGVTVYGRLYKAEKPKALILLFHQAGSSKDEYATIAPRLVTAGYSALAIDQRAGGGLYGTNETAKAFGREVRYREAMPDLQAALGWARTQKLPIILWGSSYSSSLIFPLTAKDPQGIIALLSFSPGEYFDGHPAVGAAAATLRVPVFVASGNSKDETGEADPIFAALPRNAANVRFVPDHGVHGSSTLVAAKNPAGARANWDAVMAFLSRVAPAQ
jgi:alpha-beta hydrolase superfamily lysophospholipase